MKKNTRSRRGTRIVRIIERLVDHRRNRVNILHIFLESTKECRCFSQLLSRDVDLSKILKCFFVYHSLRTTVLEMQKNRFENCHFLLKLYKTCVGHTND